MEFIPEEFRYITLSKMNEIEKVLHNCSVKEYLEAYRLFLNMITTWYISNIKFCTKTSK